MSKKFQSILNFFHIEKFENIFVRFLTGWILSLDIVSLFSNKVATKLDFVTFENIFFTVCLTVVLFVFINLIYRLLYSKGKTSFEFESVVLWFFTVFYFCFSAIFDTDVYFTVLMSALSVILSVYTVNCNKELFLSKDLKKKSSKIIVAVVFVVSFIILLLIGIFRYLSFSAPNFDLGIFTNTAYNLKTKLIEYNTCERDELITHFAVHISPILYLLTPFYFFFPSAVTLQTVQALLVISSVFPVYFICKKYELKNITVTFLCVITLLYPVLSTGTFYDFHENAFLTAFILWMIYFYEKEKRLPMYIFAFLVLLVKEDATVYVAFFALYLLFSNKRKADAVIMLLISVLYFSACVLYINKFGFGAMTNRFNDYILNGNMGLISVIFTIFTSPVYVIKNSISAEKLAFIFQVTAPLMFMPFVTKKYSRYILILPFVLMNLMPSYEFQHSINFQYLYGVSAFLLYLSIINISDLTENTRRKMLLSCVAVTFVMYSAFAVPKLYYVGKYVQNRDEYKKIEEVLDKIPDESSVTASTFFIPHIANRDEIYEFEYTDNQTKYLALDLRYEQTREDEKNLDKNKYFLVGRYDNLIALYKVKE